VARSVKLSVNNIPIDLDYFVEEYIEHIVGGIVASLRDTGDIDNLELTFDSDGQVKLYLNNADVPLKYFPMEIIKSTLEGMVLPLKGVESVINTLEIEISG
jgi:hypothetical protein